jgi:glycosyltransferase involved in cell wall biosynthesis
MYDISVVVPTHNRRSYLPGLLSSLAAQDYPPDLWEVVIVDDGSSDDTQEYLRSASASGSCPANVVVIAQPQSGVATARNNGVRAAGGRAVLFLDDDMIASPTLVREHALAHLTDAKAVVVGHLSVPSGEREPWVAWEDAQVERHFAALKSGARVPGPRDFYTGNCSVSTSLFNMAGGFDATLPRAEDVELGYRLASAGARFYYAQGADSLHLGRHPYAAWLRNAKLYGQCDVTLAWSKGHSHLQTELFRWYRGRNFLNKALVRSCVMWPALAETSYGGLHFVGRVAYKLGARRAYTACYSAIYNLAYWLSIVDELGKDQFWAYVKTVGPDTEMKHEPLDLKDAQTSAVATDR